MGDNVLVTRTMNNSLIVGPTKIIDDGVIITDPFAMIPMEDGIRLIPLDVDLIGAVMDVLELTNDKIFYTKNVSDVIINEYYKMLKGDENVQVEPVESEESEELDDQWEPETCEPADKTA
jgi:hypothetical protein